MKKLHTLLTYISSNRVWLITLVCLDLFFVFLAWRSEEHTSELQSQR